MRKKQLKDIIITREIFNLHFQQDKYITFLWVMSNDFKVFTQYWFISPFAPESKGISFNLLIFIYASINQNIGILSRSFSL